MVTLRTAAERAAPLRYKPEPFGAKRKPLRPLKMKSPAAKTPKSKSKSTDGTLTASPTPIKKKASDTKVKKATPLRGFKSVVKAKVVPMKDAALPAAKVKKASPAAAKDKSFLKKDGKKAPSPTTPKTPTPAPKKKAASAKGKAK